MWNEFCEGYSQLSHFLDMWNSDNALASNQWPGHIKVSWVPAMLYLSFHLASVYKMRLITLSSIPHRIILKIKWNRGCECILEHWKHQCNKKLLWFPKIMQENNYLIVSLCEAIMWDILWLLHNTFRGILKTS